MINTKEQIRRIKYLRLKSEERFLIDILNKDEIGYNDRYPESTFFSLNGKILFEQDEKNDRFWVSYDDIWSVLINEYQLNVADVKCVIQSMVWDTLKLKVSTPPPILIKKRFLGMGHP